ncbi:MMPL family transporter [Actinopolyspora mortivallis]|uniref:MMPL domain-containing protein n=1 Tax=Actinopolyspora mortivallis TaxID=33906 RepID=A0A2T0GWP8_ACTMO|nr:MMPL family transporter [Actinopolyspora mortivallis]PRW63453.1 MMPL domain-containing protein [Actinopolyspora mortivallis]
MFGSWGSFAHRHRLPVLVTVLLAVVAGGIWGLGVFDRFGQGGYESPNSEAARAQELADGALDSGGDVVVLYDVGPGGNVDDPAFGERVRERLSALPDSAVEQVTSYWRTPNPALVNEDGTIGLATIELAGDEDDRIEAYERIRDELDVAGADTDVAGSVPIQVSMSRQSQHDLAMAEAVSMPVVLVLLVVIFGGVVAAALPVLVGGMAVFGSFGLLHLISLLTDVNTFAVNVASLLGLGLAIDYGLFIVGRFREELATGADTGTAVRHTVGTAGRTVAFSATLLVLALGTLLLFPQSFLRSLAYGGMSSVSLAAVVSLTVLPAILGMLGGRVDGLAVPWRRGGHDAAHVPGRGWSRFASAVMKRPLLTAVPIIAVLLLLGAPFLGSTFGTPDERVLPKDDPARQGIEKLRSEFPAMSGDNVRVVVDGGDTPPRPPELRNYSREVAEIRGIGQVRPAGSAEGVVVLEATLEGDPFGERANEAVDEIRSLAPPPDSEVLVGGTTALNLDSLRDTVETLPWVAALLVGSTLVLMFLAFGSVVLPIKAVVLSALSLSATFGVLTWIFVDGHGAGLLNVTPAPMSVGVVVLMASVVFGLSTDYEVFLLSRMVEARAEGRSTPEAVRTGLARTGRMITAAALLLIVVTGAFAFSGVTMMRFIGVGMIVALVLDATVVRMVLVPALLRLLGDVSWWSPGGRRRALRGASVERGADGPRRSEPESTR